MDERTRTLLSEALQWHEACERDMAGVRDEEEALRQMVRIEHETWSESALIPENRPLTYRHLLSLVRDPGVIEQRYAECKQDYLRAIIAQRYAEVLADVNDMGTLTELAERTHHDLRPFVILRLQQVLPDALRTVSPDNLPSWFVRLLRQPWEVRNFLSQPTCAALSRKLQGLLHA